MKSRALRCAVIGLTILAGVAAAVSGYQEWTISRGDLLERIGEVVVAALSGLLLVLAIPAVLARLWDTVTMLDTNQTKTDEQLAQEARARPPLELSMPHLVYLAIGLGVFTFIIALGQRLEPGVAVVPAIAHATIVSMLLGLAVLVALLFVRRLIWRITGGGPAAA